MENLGTMCAFAFFGAPFVLLAAFRNFPNSCKPFRRQFVRHGRVLVLFYFFSVSALVSTTSSIYIENIKSNTNADISSNVSQNTAPTLPDVAKALYIAVDKGTFYLLPFLFLIIPVSFLSDKMIEKASLYNFYLGGFWDPETNDENISLRVETLCEILGCVTEQCSAGERAGQSFARTFVKKNNLGIVEKLDSFALRWSRVDAKAGWCESLEHDPIFQTITIRRPFTERLVLLDEQLKSKALAFLAGYVKGVVEVVTKGEKTIIEAMESRLDRQDVIVLFRISDLSVAEKTRS